MIHLIYIYFIVNAFVAGLFHEDLDDWGFTLVWLFFGCLFPLYLAWRWLDRTLEINTLLVLYFTDWFKKKESEMGIQLLRNSYKIANPYKRWVLRQIDKKYGWGITNEEAVL